MTSWDVSHDPLKWYYNSSQVFGTAIMVSLHCLPLVIILSKTWRFEDLGEKSMRWVTRLFIIQIWIRMRVKGDSSCIGHWDNRYKVGLTQANWEVWSLDDKLSLLCVYYTGMCLIMCLACSLLLAAACGCLQNAIPLKSTTIKEGQIIHFNINTLNVQ